MNKNERLALQEHKERREALIGEKRRLAGEMIGQGMTQAAIVRALRCAPRIVQDARKQARG